MKNKDKAQELLDKYPHIWKSKSSLMSFIRGGVRRALWNRHPVKIEFIKNNRIRIKNPNPKGKADTVWGAVCALTGQEFPLNQIEVDHKEGNHSLREISDIQSFVEAIALVTEDDLQFVSKEAHRIKSYSEKQGITFNQALVEKAVISLIKEKKDLQWLRERGIVPQSTQAKRREQIKQKMLEEQDG